MSKADADGMPQSEASGKSTLPPRAKPERRGGSHAAAAANVPLRGVAHSRWSCLIGFGTSRDSTAAHRADEREHRRPQGEKRRATRRKVSNPIFLQMQKNNGKKKKQQRANLFAKLLLAFCGDCVTILGKKTKKWHLQRDSNPCCRDENPVS